MTSMTRLQDGDATQVERLLLESASEDVPSPGARARTLIAIGVAAGITAAAPGAVHAAVGALSGGSSAKAAGTMTALMLAKWLGTGAAIGAITAACIATATTPGLLLPSVSETPSSAAAKAVPAVPKVARRSVAPLPMQNEALPPTALVAGDAPEPHAAASPSAPRLGRELAAEGVPAGGVAGASAPFAGSTGNGSRVLAEVASLDRARAALASGDARSALVRLSGHERQFPGGALEPEAVVLKVRALLKVGQRADATGLVNRFLAAHPNSSQAARLRALVGTPER